MERKGRNRRDSSNLKMMSDIWTDMEMKRLIFGVALHQELYDINYKSQTTDKIWHEIAGEFEAKTALQCYDQWKTVEAEYKIFLASGKTAESKFYFDWLDFLDPIFYKPKIKLEPMDAEEKPPVLSQRKPVLNEDYNSMQDLIQEWLQLQNRELRLANPTTNIELFFQSILNDVNQLSERNKRLFRINVLSVLFKLNEQNNIHQK